MGIHARKETIDICYQPSSSKAEKADRPHLQDTLSEETAHPTVYLHLRALSAVFIELGEVKGQRPCSSRRESFNRFGNVSKPY